MKTPDTPPLSDDGPAAPLSPVYRQIQQYYDIAGPDYESWSRNFNMHFGYCRRLSDIFCLEKMLSNMNDEVLSQLAIDKTSEVLIADLGCGMGAVARHAADKFPFAKITGITISDWQVQKGNELIRAENMEERVSIIKDNFEELRLPDETFTHAWAIESACHAASAEKELFIMEMARILKQGGRFCIADGFLKNNKTKPRIFRWLYRKIVNYWAVPGFACITDFENKLRQCGLTNIKTREISYRISPSVLYVPLVCLKFLIKEISKNRSLRMKKERWNNVYAPLLGMVMGLYRKHFGYYIITGERK